MSRFIIIPRIQVQRANAQTSYLTTNAAFVMPSLMLAHALGRKIGVAIKGVSYIHHDFQMLGELQYGKMMPHQRRGAVFIDSDDYSSKNKYALSLQPTASCHVTITLIIELDDGRFEFSDVERFVQKAKFAGGDIIRHGKIESANMIDDKTIKTGFYLIDRSDLMTQERTLETFISTLGQPFSEEKNNSWLTPFVKGYATLSGFSHRAGARAGYEHAFVEPMISLAQYVSVRSYQQAHRRTPFWTMQWTERDYFTLIPYFV